MALKTYSEDRHVGVFPYPFTSHPFVMFKLVNNLAYATPNVHFSFFNTTKSNNSLLSKKNLNLPPNIMFYNLDIDGCDTDNGFDDIFQEIDIKLKSMVAPGYFQRGVGEAETRTSSKITCFLVDAFFCSYISSMAEDRKASLIALWAPSPCSLPAFLQLENIQHLYHNVVRPKELILDVVPGLSGVSYLDIPCKDLIEGGLFSFNSTIGSLVLSTVRNMHRASTIVMNSFQELDPDALTNHVKSMFQNVLFLSTLTLSESLLSSNDDSTGCLSWLDGQKAESVIYICPGTAVQWLPEECLALAEALHVFDVPFLWVSKDELKDHLPSGFLDMTKGKVVSWAPQSHILKHPSIGVCVTHGGYNSILESIAGGVPMICNSICVDNHLNAKMIEEVWKNGVRIEGTKITKEGMIKCLETIFKDAKGKKIRENVNNLKQVLIKAAGSDGVAAQDFKTLVHKISKE
ncbi:UDP-Glycosyltransferase superfamily protein [Euphorbia peplus]|nr:UDP-Glycosyltransferase superfamily protein [Euphorbia peplus]